MPARKHAHQAERGNVGLNELLDAREDAMKDRDFCTRLTELRKRKGLTQAQVAERGDMDSTVICHYESGDRAPGLAAIKSLCKGLDCTATELIGI